MNRFLSKSDIIKSIIVVLTIIFLTNCSNPIHQENKAIKSVVNEDFVFSVLDFKKLSHFIKNKHSKEFDLIKTPRSNIHNATEIDTLISFCSKKVPKDEIHYYKAGDKTILQSAVLKGDNIILANNVKVGMEKIQLTQYLNLQQVEEDIISITDLEGNIKWTFYFNSNQLDSIKFCGYLD